MAISANLDNKGDLNAKWEIIASKLKQYYGDATYHSWFKHLEFVSNTGDELTLSAPSRFIREWIIANYALKIKSLWQAIDPKVKRLIIVVDKSRKANSIIQVVNGKKNSVFINGKPQIAANQQNVLQFEEEYKLGSPLDKRYTFDNFVIGDSNNLAFAAAKSIAETNLEPEESKKPLFLYGGVGLGKTHLMHAIAWEIRNNHPERKVIYMSAEKFMYQFIQALRNNDMMNFKDKFNNIDILMIDDVQFICGKESTQEEFFHTINSFLDLNKQIVISGDRSPSDLDGMKEKVKSRLGWGLVVDLNATDYDLRLGILKSKSSLMSKVKIPSNVLEFVANKITSNIRELEGALNKVIAHSTLVNKEITLDSTKNILSDLLRANERNVTILDIQNKVASYFGLKVTDLKSVRRSRSIARPRQIAMYLSKKLTTRSLTEIGNKFGGKDHTTVMHAVKKVEELIDSDCEFKNDVTVLQNSF